MLLKNLTDYKLLLTLFLSHFAIFCCKALGEAKRVFGRSLIRLRRIKKSQVGEKGSFETAQRV